MKLRGRTTTPAGRRRRTLFPSARGAKQTTPHGTRQRRLADEPVVFSVRADPEPLNSAVHIVSEDSVVSADASRPERADAFEMKRWMARIHLEQLVVLVGKRTDVLWQGSVQCPKSR